MPLLLAALCALALLPARAYAAPDLTGWELTFQDDFEGADVDSSAWVKRYKWGEAPINHELQAYVDDAFQVQNGVLTIQGERRSATYAGATRDYTSGVLCSVHEQTYGYVEARLKVPAGKGMWPAFWLLHANGTPDVNEIDVHEILGHQPTRVYMTDHWGTSYGSNHLSDGTSWDGPDFSADFHTFGLQWTPEAIVWFIDGVERYRHTGAGIPSVPMYVILNLAIGGDWPGAPDSTTPFPAQYQVDYVREYTKIGGYVVPPPSSSSASGCGTRGAAVSGALGALAALVALRRRRHGSGAGASGRVPAPANGAM